MERRRSLWHEQCTTRSWKQDFSPHYETEACLRAGDERQAREAVQRLEEALGANRRFRIPYLQSLALLTAWERETEQAIGQLREAAQLAAEIGLSGEQWQVQTTLGRMYEANGNSAEATSAFGKAATIIQELARGIGDETLRSRFLAGPQTHSVLQRARPLATSILDDRTEPDGKTAKQGD
jgi:tetratricopeptide (TPR) repeat protein